MQHADLCCTQAYGVIGCVSFLEGHYLLLVTKRQYQGSLCGHKVYSISDTALVPLKQATAQVHVLADSLSYQIAAASDVCSFAGSCVGVYLSCIRARFHKPVRPSPAEGGEHG
jgi:SacI homology domain